MSPETFIVGPNNVGKSTFIAAYWFFRFLGYNYPLTKFRSYQESVFMRKYGPAIIMTLRGKFEGNLVERTIRIPPSGGLTWGDTGNVHSLEILNRTVSDTWYLSSDRIFIPIEQGISGSNAIIDFRAGNIVPFLLERWTSQDLKWTVAQEWIRRIDPGMTTLKSPLRSGIASIETSRKYGKNEVDVNVSFQGGGIQRALQLVSALVFSPEGSVIIMEEPEMNLHKETQETIVDLMNTAVNEWGKQVIVTTHSWDMILPFISDVDHGSPRGERHVKAKRENFRLVTFDFEQTGIKIADYDLSKKKYAEIVKDFNLIWGGFEEH